MKKYVLNIEPDYDFDLIGLVCNQKDYRMCWLINTHLGFDFTRTNSIILSAKKDNTPLVKDLFEEESSSSASSDLAEYSVFSYFNEENHSEYYLISNKSDSGLLIPEQARTDYFLMLNGYFEESYLLNFQESIKKIPGLVTCFSINPKELKSKQNLLID